MFITFEGVEGCGKTSQVQVLGDTLLRMGVAATLTREPGGSPIGAPLRSILLSDQYAVCPRAELLLYAAERAEHVERVIRPALGRGEWVLCDRFGDATRAYQSWGRGIPRAEVELVHSLATGGLEPDLTVLLRIPVEFSLERARSRDGASPAGEGRFEAEDLAFHRRVAQGYEALALEEPQRFVVVEAMGTREEVAARVWSALEERLAL